jgi:hypothetical protein
MSVTELDAELAQRVERLSSEEYRRTDASFEVLTSRDWLVLIGVYALLPIVVALAVLV